MSQGAILMLTECAEVQTGSSSDGLCSAVMPAIASDCVVS